MPAQRIKTDRYDDDSAYWSNATGSGVDLGEDDDADWEREFMSETRSAVPAEDAHALNSLNPALRAFVVSSLPEGHASLRPDCAVEASDIARCTELLRSESRRRGESIEEWGERARSIVSNALTGNTGWSDAAHHRHRCDLVSELFGDEVQSVSIASSLRAARNALADYRRIDDSWCKSAILAIAPAEREKMYRYHAGEMIERVTVVLKRTGDLLATTDALVLSGPADLSILERTRTLTARAGALAELTAAMGDYVKSALPDNLNCRELERRLGAVEEALGSFGECVTPLVAARSAKVDEICAGLQGALQRECASVISECGVEPARQTRSSADADRELERMMKTLAEEEARAGETVRRASSRTAEIAELARLGALEKEIERELRAAAAGAAEGRRAEPA